MIPKTCDKVFEAGEDNSGRQFAVFLSRATKDNSSPSDRKNTTCNDYVETLCFSIRQRTRRSTNLTLLFVAWISLLFIIKADGVHAWAPTNMMLSVRSSRSRVSLSIPLFALTTEKNDESLSTRQKPLLPSPSFPSGSTVCFTDPVTGCEVVLLGCFHGARSSADDVRQCLEAFNDDIAQNPNTNPEPSIVIALELCATRFADLRRDVQKDLQQQQQLDKSEIAQSTSDSDTNNDIQEDSGSTLLIMSENEERSWLVRFQEMVAQTVQQRGWSTGLAAALLGAVSGMQTALSGLEPGLEFRTALGNAMIKGGQQQQQSPQPLQDNVDDSQFIAAYNRDIPIVLADQNVDETLERIGRIPSEAVALWKDFLSNPINNWSHTFGIEAMALGKAVGLLDPSPSATASQSSPSPKVTLGGFATRSPKAIRDLVRLMLPPVLTLQAGVLAVNIAFEWLRAQPEWIDAAAAHQQAAIEAASLSSSGESAVLAWSNIFIFTSLYMSLALPAVKVILRERDDILAHNIRQACELAMANNPTHQGRVVAVLGLLHVNGVAERLLQEKESPSSPTESP